LSAIFSRAIHDEVVDFNPCSRFEQEPEAKRERSLTPTEQVKLMEVLVDDLAYLLVPIEVSLGTGVRKHTELLKLMPMNSPVREALQKVIDSRTTGNVFDYKQTGVSASTLRRGFEKAWERAGIPFGLTVEGGVIWHDLRRSFATELRGRQVQESFATSTTRSGKPRLRLVRGEA
jgi:hypothetical protein